MTRSRLSACAFFSLILWSTTVAAQPPISGRVVDATGEAIPRVPVTLSRADGTTVAVAVADDRGRFTFAQACPACVVSAALPGFQPAATAVNTTADLRLTLALAPIRESVVVTATRSTAPTSQVGASVTVFDEAAIERSGAVLVGDLLRQAPGVAVVQNGGRGAVASLFVRGGENNYTKVLLDGIPLNEPGGSFNFGGLTTGHVERVELVRGAQSAIFGSDAMAGVLQLVSHRGRAGSRPEWRGEVSGGGYGSQTLRGQVSGGTGRLTYSAFGAHQATDNRVPNSRSESDTASITAGFTFSPALRATMVGRWEAGDTGTPGQTAFGRPDLDASFTQDHRVGGLTLEHTAGRVSQRLTYALAWSRQRSTNLETDPPYTPAYKGRTAPFEFFDFTYDAGSTFRRHHASYQADLRLTHGGVLAGAELFTLAADWDGERGDLRDYLAGTQATPSRDNVGVTLQHQHVSARLAVTTGLRFEDNASFGRTVVPRVSVSWLVRPGGSRLGATRLTANAGTGIKEPTLRQSFSLSPFDRGNPELEAERSRTVDVGVQQRLLDDRVRVDVTAFDNRFRNQISTRTISFSPYLAQYVNVGTTDARGVELGIELAPVTGLRVVAHHTMVDSEIIDRASEFSDVLAPGRWALRRPRHSGAATVFVDRGRWSVDVGAVWLGRRSDSDFSSLVPAITEAPGYSLWHGQAAVRLSTIAVLFARVDNLTDVDYMEPLGYPAWRRSAQAGLRLKF